MGEKSATAWLKHGLTGLVVCLCGPGVAMAQTSVPGAVQPGRIEQPFVRQPAVRPAPQPELQVGSQPPLSEEAARIRFTVTGLVLEGASMLARKQTDPLLSKFSGRDSTLADIYALADQLTALYRNEGYVLTRVVVPEQRIVDGRVRLVAVEGYVDQVVFEGATPVQEWQLQRYAEHIKASRPLRADVLERYLLLMNDLSGCYAQAIVRASPNGVGAADLVIQFSSRKADASVEISNRGSRALGPVSLTGNVIWHSPLRRFDQLQLTVAGTPNDELRVLSLGYDIPLGANGFTVGLTGSAARAHPELGGGVEVRTHSSSGQLRMSYPTLRTRTQNLYLRSAYAWLNGRTEVAGLPLTNDKLRTVRLGMAYDLTDGLLGINSADLEVVRGLNSGNVTQANAADSSRAGARPDFSKASLYLARLQSLRPRLDLLAAVSAQTTSDKMFPSEQFGFGGGSFGRAYDASELLGDTGAAVKLELRYAMAAWRSSTVYAFYEAGKVKRRDPVNEAERESAADLGAGLRFNLLDSLSGYVEVAKPLTRDAEHSHDRGARVFAALRWSL